MNGVAAIFEILAEPPEEFTPTNTRLELDPGAQGSAFTSDVKAAPAEKLIYSQRHFCTSGTSVLLLSPKTSATLQATAGLTE